MTKIIVIRGKANSGKTTSCGLIYKEILKISEKTHTFNGHSVEKDSLVYGLKGELIDFLAIIKIKNKTIVIISAGDIAKILAIHLDKYIKLKFDIIICCARSKNSKGSSYRMILNAIPEPKESLFEFWIQRGENEQLNNKSKQSLVGDIVLKIKELVN